MKGGSLSGMALGWGDEVNRIGPGRGKENKIFAENMKFLISHFFSYPALDSNFLKICIFLLDF